MAVLGPSDGPLDARAVGDRLASENPDRPLGAQDAGFGLVEHERQVARPERRKQRPGVHRARAARPGSGGSTSVASDFRLPSALAMGEPGDAALNHELGPGFGFDFSPERSGAVRERV
jgi:hypothetical protein